MLYTKEKKDTYVIETARSLKDNSMFQFLYNKV